MRRNKVLFRMAIVSVLAALYFILARFGLRLGGYRITFASVPVLFASLAFGTPEGIFVALLGEFLNQLTGEYGLTVTTPLWILPPAIRGLTVGLVSYFYKKKGTRLDQHNIAFFTTLIVASLLTSLANTGVIYLDAYIFNYPAGYTIYETFIRFIISTVTAVVVGFVLVPLMRATRSLLQRN